MMKDEGEIKNFRVRPSIYTVHAGREVNLSFPAQADASEAQPLQADTLMHDLMLYLPHCCYTQRLFLGESLDDLDTVFLVLAGKIVSEVKTFRWESGVTLQSSSGTDFLCKFTKQQGC